VGFHKACNQYSLISKLRSHVPNSFMLSDHPYNETESGEHTDVLYNDAANC